MAILTKRKEQKGKQKQRTVTSDTPLKISLNDFGSALLLLFIGYKLNLHELVLRAVSYIQGLVSLLVKLSFSVISYHLDQ